MLLLAIACKPHVLFEYPQPEDGEKITEFPIEYQGMFYSESDSTIIFVNDKVVYAESPLEFITTIQEVIDSENCTIKDGGVQFPHTTQCVPFEYLSEDTIMGTMILNDTLFDFNETQSAKLYKDKLFLNVGDDNGNWISNMITKEANGDLSWDLISLPDNENKIAKMVSKYRVEMKKDSHEIYIINPTTVELQEILDKGYLKRIEKLIQYNIENPI